MQNEQQIYWLLGSSRAGKTTISRLLAEDYGFTVYHLDEQLFGKLWPSKTNERNHPYVRKVISFNQNYHDYYNRAMEEIMEETVAAFYESWPLVYNDIMEIADEGHPVLVEGGSIFPEMIAPLAAKDRALFLLPTRDFQRDIFVDGMNLEEGEEPSHEGQYFHAYPDVQFLVEQRVEHHDRIAKHVEKKALENGYRVLYTHRKEDLNNNIRQVKQIFNLTNSGEKNELQAI